MHKNQQDDSVNSQTQPNKTKKNKKKWSAIPNAIIKDIEISANAFRVYCYLEMKPDSWTYNQLSPLLSYGCTVDNIS